jgi:hypothetical protein
MNKNISQLLYSESSNPITQGDRISVDGNLGFVKLVCLPKTNESHYYSCQETGGILVLYDNGILILELFESYHFFEKISLPPGSQAV